MGPLPPLDVRVRTDADVPVLAALLADQQPHTGYPQSWPLPYPVEHFIARRHELAAWVAEDSGRVVGHVSVAEVGPGVEADGWMAHTGRGRDELAAVTVLFVDHRQSGRGVGGALLETAVGFIREAGRVPVLDVVQETENAVRLYLRHGWQVVGEVRPEWLPEDLRPALLMVLPD
jgi:GNAT superfamily N-acetyltransferase